MRATQKTAKIETLDVGAPERLACFPVERMYKPEAAGRAQMLEGSPEEIADKIVEVMTQNSLI